MIVEIDQSGKVEETARDTIIAFADKKGFARSLKITAREKRKLQKFFREIGKPRFYVQKIFAVLIFILIKDYLPKLDRIIIDLEYSGYEKLLMSLIGDLAKRHYKNFDPHCITFKQIGKKSPAHGKAYHTFRKKLKANITVTAKDILKIISK